MNTQAKATRSRQKQQIELAGNCRKKEETYQSQVIEETHKEKEDTHRQKRIW
jgi:hypothetical protein